MDRLDLTPDINDIAQEVLREESTYEYMETASMDTTDGSITTNGLDKWSNYIPPIKSNIPAPSRNQQWGKIQPTVAKSTWGRIQTKSKTPMTPSNKVHITGYEGIPKSGIFAPSIPDTFSKLFKSNPSHALGNNKG